MSNHIPTEIIIDILARLPVKTLLRFTSVCKLWYSIITNPDFITTHLNWSSERNADQLLFHVNNGIDEKDSLLLIPDEEKSDEKHTKVTFPFDKTKRSNEYFYLVGSCNGLVFLCENGYENPKHVIIWNPCICKSITLALPIKPMYNLVIGLGFFLGKSEFKVVMITSEDCKGKGPLEVEVYEHGGERDWRVIRCAPPHNHIVCPTRSQVLLHGAIHWIAYYCSNRFHTSIVGFDMCNEVFREIAVPPILAKESPTVWSVTLFKCSLAVLSETGSCLEGKWSLWVMREYGDCESWTNLYNIGIPGMRTWLAFRKNGVILLKANTGAVVSYDFETQKITNTNVPKNSFRSTVHNFTESLVLLEAVPGLFANLF